MVVAKHAQLDYNVTNLGNVSNAVLSAIMAAVPAPIAELAALGCTVSSDQVITGGGSPTVLTRRLTLLFQNVAATASASVVGGHGAVGPILALTLLGGGATYATIPIVQITETATGVTPLKKAQAHATLNVRGIAATNGGSGYSASPTVTLVGGLAPGGVPATAQANVVAGVIHTIPLITAGGPYVYTPSVVITDPTGTGAIGTADMQVASLVLDNPGDGYESPVVTITDFFDYVWPAGVADQRQPFYNILTNAIRAATSSPVQAVAPVLTP